MSTAGASLQQQMTEAGPKADCEEMVSQRMQTQLLLRPMRAGGVTGVIARQLQKSHLVGLPAEQIERLSINWLFQR